MRMLIWEVEVEAPQPVEAVDVEVEAGPTPTVEAEAVEVGPALPVEAEGPVEVEGVEVGKRRGVTIFMFSFYGSVASAIRSEASRVREETSASVQCTKRAEERSEEVVELE